MARACWARNERAGFSAKRRSTVAGSAVGMVREKLVGNVFLPRSHRSGPELALIVVTGS